MGVKRQISVTLDEEVIEELDKLAEGMGLGRSTMLNSLLRTGFMGDYAGMYKVARKASKKNSEGMAFGSGALLT